MYSVCVCENAICTCCTNHSLHDYQTSRYKQVFFFSFSPSFPNISIPGLGCHAAAMGGQAVVMVRYKLCVRDMFKEPTLPDWRARPFIAWHTSGFLHPLSPRDLSLTASCPTRALAIRYGGQNTCSSSYTLQLYEDEDPPLRCCDVVSVSMLLWCGLGTGSAPARQ